MQDDLLHKNTYKYANRRIDFKSTFSHSTYNPGIYTYTQRFKFSSCLYRTQRIIF